MSNTKNVTRVCIVGGGASGLGCARVLLEYNLEPVVFEQQPFIGGQWHYQSAAGLDEERLTSAIYRDLTTNLSCSVMQFSDFPFVNSDAEDYVTPNDMELYLSHYAEQHELHKYLVLNAEVINIEEKNRVFFVKYCLKNGEAYKIPDRLITDLSYKVDKSKRILLSQTENDTTYAEYFDAVCICNGHYSKPYFPDIEGLNNVPGSKICHSMSYRYSEEYQDKIVIVIGGSHSGIDIAGELLNHAQKVFLSMKQQNDFDPIIRRLRLSKKKTCLDYGDDRFTIKPPIQRITNGRIAYFEDGTIVEPDFIIAATGYDYEFRFLSEKNLVLQYDKRRFLYPLYRQLFNVNYPQGLFSYLTIPFRVVPFPLCEVQAHVVARCLKNEIQLPTTNEMMKEIDEEISDGNVIDRNYHKMNMIDYIKNLFQLMQNDDNNTNRAYKFRIDNDRRVRKLDKITNEVIVEQTMQNRN